MDWPARGPQRRATCAGRQWPRGTMKRVQLKSRTAKNGQMEDTPIQARKVWSGLIRRAGTPGCSTTRHQAVPARNVVAKALRMERTARMAAAAIGTPVTRTAIGMKTSSALLGPMNATDVAPVPTRPLLAKGVRPPATIPSVAASAQARRSSRSLMHGPPMVDLWGRGNAGTTAGPEEGMSCDQGGIPLPQRRRNPCPAAGTGVGALGK